MSLQAPSDPFAIRRAAMVSLQLRNRGICDERVLAAMTQVPRHEFVSQGDLEKAYEDQPLEIAAGQTISQPYIVAAMLQALRLRAADRVLEVGTGSGYQTALLSRLASGVFTMERHPLLLESARSRLERLGYGNIVYVAGDGSLGLPDQAPFDAIIVSAASPAVPPSLTAQLNDGGRLIIPVGTTDAQQLQLIARAAGEISVENLDACRFVPLVGREAFPA